MEFDVVQYASRALHILFAVTAAGGAIFMKFALHPAAETLADEPRRALKEAVRARWSKVVMISITMLLATGFFNYFKAIGQFALKGTPYHPVIGVKILLALAIFFLASVLVGRSAMAQKAREQAGKWLTVLVALIVVLLALSSYLKLLPHVPKAAEPAAAAAPASSS